MLDIDFFKHINDEHGHLQGDRVLQDLAAVAAADVRDCDILARYGGEEFVILMPHTELPGACNLCERLRAAVAERLPITVSIGLAVVACEGDTASTLALAGRRRRCTWPRARAAIASTSTRALRAASWASSSRRPIGLSRQAAPAASHGASNVPDMAAHDLSEVASPQCSG